jgi:hypothetical protein
MRRKKQMKIKYHTLQSQSGFLIVSGYEYRFVRIEVKGNNLVLYEPDNDLTENGRIGKIFDLNKYELV